MSEVDRQTQLEHLLASSRLEAEVDGGLHARLMANLGRRNVAPRRRRIAVAAALAGSLALLVHVGWRLAAPPATPSSPLLPRITQQLRCLEGQSPASLCPGLPVAEAQLRREWLALKSDLQMVVAGRNLAAGPPPEEPG